jgi:hypothetical protein
VIGKSRVQEQHDRALTRAQKSEEREIEADGCGDSRGPRADRASRLRQQQTVVLLGPHQSRELDQESAERYLQQRCQRSEDADRNDPEDATSLVNAAKSDFPTETSAVKPSVNTLQSALKALRRVLRLPRSPLTPAAL